MSKQPLSPAFKNAIKITATAVLITGYLGTRFHNEDANTDSLNIAYKSAEKYDLQHPHGINGVRFGPPGAPQIDFSSQSLMDCVALTNAKSTPRGGSQSVCTNNDMIIADVSCKPKIFAENIGCHLKIR